MRLQFYRFGWLFSLFLVISCITTPGVYGGDGEVVVGSKIPDVTLKDAQGRKVRLWDRLGSGALVLFFYPKDGTSGCTREACAFRDAHETFREAGAEVIGISSDSEQSHRRFARENQLPYLLLSDPGGKVRRRFGVPSDLLGLIPGRVTYVIDRQGVVRHRFRSQLQFERHVQEALRTVRAIGKSD